jgi:hypothetical protein
VAILPPDTAVEDLARVDRLSFGVMSTGVGAVPAAQTYLDIGQGNRVSSQLYDAALPAGNRLLGFTDDHAELVPGWSRIVHRAASAPADIRPGLLASTLQSRGVPVRVERGIVAPALTAVNRRGVVRWVPPHYLPCRRRLCKGVTLLQETLHNTRKLVGRLRGNDLLIALPVLEGERITPIGVAGRGFNGDLTSDSTRTDGYVLSTDIASTILERFAISIPDEMSGEPIRAEGSVDAAGVESLRARMSAIPDRREPILVICLLAWSVLAFAVNRIVFGLRRVAFAWLALAFAYMPLLLLLGAWLEPGAAVEGLLVGFGAAGLAALTVGLAWGWRGLAIACAITVVAYAIDVVAGSDLTRLSLLGPNPIFGVRFYGIGNELEALIAVMVPVGVGAALSAYTGRGREVRRSGKPINEGRAAGTFLVVGLLAGLTFGVGRWGADVGAAITLPVGAAVAAIAVPVDLEHFPGSQPGNRSRFTFRRVLIAVVGAPLVALVVLALIDLVSGGNSHLTRSVIDAGGASDLADVAERRLRLSAHDFAQAAGNPLFWIVIVGIGVAVSQWRRVDAWLRRAPLARAGLIGACAAVAVGVLVNDSGASFLVLGSLALGAFLAFAWSQAGEIGSSPRNPEANRG